MDERTLTTREHPANPTLVLTLIAFPPRPDVRRHRPCTNRDAAPKQAVCLSRRGTTATGPGRGGTGFGDNEASHDAGTVQLLDEEARQAPRPHAFRYRPGRYSRYPCGYFHPNTDFVNEIRVRLAGTRICALFAREIKGEAFDDLWSEASREQVHEVGLVIAEIISDPDTWRCY